MKIIQYNIPQYQEIGGKEEEVTRFFRGLSSFDPLSIQPNFFTELENFNFEDSPALKTRSEFEIMFTYSSNIIGMSVWKGQELHVIFGNGDWFKFDGDSWTIIGSGYNTSANYTFTNFQGKEDDVYLYACNGHSKLLRYDGTSISQVGNPPDDINHITTYQNRLWGSSGNVLHASKLDDAEEWQEFSGQNDDSFFKTIESERGENISFLSGGLTKLLIGTPNSIKELYGGLPSEFNDRTVTEDVGIQHGLAGYTHEGVLWFVHYSGIYTYSGGTNPSKELYNVISEFRYDLSTIKEVYSYKNYVLFCLSDRILVYDSRPEVQSWVEWTGKNINALYSFNDRLYLGGSGNDRNIYRLDSGITKSYTENLDFKLVTKVFTSYSIAKKQRLYKVYLTVEVDSNTELNVYASNSIENNDWELVSSLTGNGNEVKRILVPVNKFAIENFIRIKIEGSGYFKLYEINRQFRTMPLV